jgi:hypothetical protein
VKDSSLGVVCCYFNPIGYKSRYDNFIEFYSSLKKQIKSVHVIEMDSPLRLPEEIGSKLVSSKSILWYKENLLNIGISDLLDDGYENIAWLDSDIFFHDSFWVKDTVDCLNNYNLCQLFSRALKISENESCHTGCVRYWHETGNIYPLNTFCHTGYAWAARSECLKKCLLYDKGIVGGGDSLIWFGSFDGVVNIFELLQPHPIFKLNINAYIMNYLDWSEKWGKVINGEVSYVYNNIRVPNQGSNYSKQYIARYNILLENKFSPKKDLIYNNNILECTNEKLQKDILKYFNSRKEDSIGLLGRLSRHLDSLALKKEIKEADDFLSKNL